MKNGFFSKVANKSIVRVFAYNSSWDARTNMKPRPKWMKSFAEHAHMHNSKPANGAISPIFQNWVTYFYAYFNDMYATCTSKWAFCFRIGSAVNTNMFVEAFHRKLKTILKEKVFIVDQRLSDDLCFAVLNGRETGASSWLTVVSMKAHGFALHKGDFQDAIALRYGWVPSHLPLKCVRGSTFTVEHAMSCSHGGLPSHRHYELRDLTASLLAEVCTDVKTEPDLQPLTGESMHHHTAVTTVEARLDVHTQGFWGSRFTQDYFDVKVFNPLARSYKNKPLRSTYGDLEWLKRSYEQRVREIEHGTFTPPISSASGGLGKAAHLTYRRLASLLSAKWMLTLPIADLHHFSQLNGMNCHTLVEVSHFFLSPLFCHLMFKELEINFKA